MNVAAQEAFHCLIEEELQIEGARIRQRDHKAGQGAAGAAHRHMSEVRPVGLCLLARKHLQAQKRLAGGGAQPGHGAPQLNDAAAVAAVTNHLIDAGGAKTRMLVQRLTDEGEPRIHNRASYRLCAATKTLCLDRVAHRVRMQTEFAGDGADLPVLGVEVPTNLRPGFRTDHETAHLRAGMRGNGSTKRPVRPQSRHCSQRPRRASGRRGSRVAPDLCDGAAPASPQPNNAGQVIEREP